MEVVSFFLWYLLISLVGLATVPLASLLFPSFADRGYSLARVLGLLLWGYLYWILVSFNLLQNDTAGALTTLVLYSAAALAIYSALTGGKGGDGLFSNIRKYLGQQKRTILTIELLFLGSILFWAFIRALNPEVSGTEKPMELAFINAILRSPSFPPNDPWLSGYSISYYYFGYILAAMLAAASNTAGSVAFNLMIVFVISLSVIGSYGILFNLLNRGVMVDNIKVSLKNTLAPILAPVFLTLVSNAEGALEVLRSLGVGWKNGAAPFWMWLNMKDLNVAPEVPFTWPPRFWFWWRASRVLQDHDFTGRFVEVIDEFPLFSFLLGDLHPHVLAIPFGLLLAAMCLNLLWQPFKGQEQRRMTFLAILAIALGGIAFLNTWDLPIYFSLVSTVLLINAIKEDGGSGKVILNLLKIILPLGALSILLYLPFYIGFSSQAGGLLPNVVFPTRGVYLWIMFLPLWLPLILGLVQIIRQHRVSLVDGSMITLILVSVLMGLSLAMAWVGKDFPEGAAFISSQGFTTFKQFISASILRRFEFIGGLLTLMVIITFATSILIAYFTSKINRTTLFVVLLGLFGGLLVLAPEFVYLRDQFGTRMNTVFKFYYQAWIFWSLAASYATILLIEKSRGIGRLAIGFVLGSGILIGLVYPVTALPNKIDLQNLATKQFISLDGSSHYKINNIDEWNAFQWLNSQPLGVVVEAVGGSYTEYARFSTFTGQPSVLGWPGHESQWRGGFAEMGNRQGDIETIYTTRDWLAARDLLIKYNVDYIIVGTMERNTYAVFEDKFRDNLPTVYNTDSITIYLAPMP